MFALCKNKIYWSNGETYESNNVRSMDTVPDGEETLASRLEWTLISGGVGDV